MHVKNKITLRNFPTESTDFSRILNRFAETCNARICSGYFCLQSSGQLVWTLSLMLADSLPLKLRGRISQANDVIVRIA
jgi:hypothetical protein